MLINTN